MPDDIEKRIGALERNHDSIAGSIIQLNRTLEKLEERLEVLFDMKSKVTSVDTAWKKIDQLTIELRSLDKDFHLMRSEHNTCKPIVDTIAACKSDFDARIRHLESSIGAAKGFLGGRLGAVFDQLIPIAMAMVAAYLVAKGAK